MRMLVHGQQYKALYGETQMGSTPMEAILMATRDAAKALGKEQELGTVEAGKLACHCRIFQARTRRHRGRGECESRARLAPRHISDSLCGTS